MLTVTIGTEPYACIEIENHSSFFMVNIASGINCRQVHPNNNENDDAVQNGSYFPADRSTDIYSVRL